MQPWIDATWSAPANVRALTTTCAVGGLSPQDAGSEEAAADNRRALLARLELDHAQWLDQVHGNECFNATRSSVLTVPTADASWTSEKGVGLAIQTADCVPIVLSDAAGETIGAAHGGWRGLVSGVIGSLVSAMNGATPLHAWIGPAIGPDAYEVGRDVFDAVVEASGTDEFLAAGGGEDKWQLDLFGLSLWLLRQQGITEVRTDRLCTYTDERFFSYRQNRATGRMATVIWKR